MQPDRIASHARKLAAKRATRCTLYLVGIDDAEAEDLGDWQLSDYEGDLIKDLAAELADCAQSDVDERGGSRKYRVIGYDAEDTIAYKWQMRMTAEPQGDSSGNGHADPPPSLELDEPTAQGLLAQAMRHQERQFSVCMASQERIVRSLQAQLDARDRRIAQLEARELEVIETLRMLRLQSGDPASERNADRIDRALTLITEKFLPAAGVQLGFLPEGFDPQKPIDALKQKLLEGDGDKSNGAGDDTVAPPPGAADASA